jgi:arrestin-related trafficking adapter 4/5/7
MVAYVPSDLNALTPISSRQGADVDLLASTLHQVLQGTTHHTHHTDRQDSAHRRDDKHTGIELVVNTDVLALKGAGAEVTPALLSGQIVLDLAESTSVKEITLQFRGKAKLPPVENEPWVFCFLQGGIDKMF